MCCILPFPLKAGKYESTKPPRTYKPKPGVGSPCPLCHEPAKNSVDLQTHLNTAHPGWAVDYINKILQNRKWEN